MPGTHALKSLFCQGNRYFVGVIVILLWNLRYSWLWRLLWISYCYRRVGYKSEVPVNGPSIIAFLIAEGERTMEKYIPFEKLSKKKKRELNAKRRNTWGCANPVTRKPDPPKAYNRRKAPKWNDDSNSVPFLILLLRECFFQKWLITIWSAFQEPNLWIFKQNMKSEQCKCCWEIYPCFTLTGGVLTFCSLYSISDLDSIT